MILQHRSSGTREHTGSSQQSRSQCEQYHGRALPTMASTSTGGSPPIPSRSALHVSGRQPHVRCVRRRPTQNTPGKAFPRLWLITDHSSLIASSLPMVAPPEAQAAHRRRRRLRSRLRAGAPICQQDRQIEDIGGAVAGTLILREDEKKLRNRRIGHLRASARGGWSVLNDRGASGRRRAGA